MQPHGTRVGYFGTHAFLERLELSRSFAARFPLQQDGFFGESDERQLRVALAPHLSQPALTKQINRLEDALGGILLERDKHGSKLTTLGERFLPRAKEAWDASTACSRMRKRKPRDKPAG